MKLHRKREEIRLPSFNRNDREMKPIFNGKGKLGKLKRWRLEKRRRIRSVKTKHK